MIDHFMAAMTLDNLAISHFKYNTVLKYGMVRKNLQVS